MEKGARPKQEGSHDVECRQHDSDAAVIGLTDEVVLEKMKNLQTPQERDQYVARLVQAQPASERKEVFERLVAFQFEAAPYFDTYGQNFDALFNQGNFRLAADIAWDAFKQATKWGGLWSPGRIFLFCMYCDCCSRIMTEPGHTHLMEHKDAHRMQRLFRDEGELTTVRVLAGYSIGFLPSKMMTHEEKLDVFRGALLLIPTQEEIEQKTIYYPDDEDNNKKVLLVSEVLQTHKEMINDSMNELLKQGGRFQYMESGKVSAEEFLDAGQDAELHRRTTQIGGCECDYCHVTVEELGVAKLKLCGKCQNAFYCGTECQKKAWKEGHKKACRPGGCIYPGDIMRLTGLTYRPNMPLLDGHLVMPDLNGRLVEVLRQDSHNPDFWVVGFKIPLSDAEKDLVRISVHPVSLKHIRPAA